ncbi:methyl-accepting chemotaxis protein [Vibrio sonorensis]|uniref:methyl-accepting chemotaxis protein n=1 Tax=Vibrio sonorensis TaxID=1004316 RepID=UPI0008DA4220|nr:methyl-accepting chemotaxis protein [Vibrio sonorensis]
MQLFNSFLNQLKVASKIRLIILLSSLFIIGIEVMSAVAQRNAILTERKEAAQSLVESIVNQVHYAAQSDDISDDQIKRLVGSVRYDENGYFFIHNLDGVMIMHALKPELNNQDMRVSSAINARNAVLRFIEVAKQQGSGFVTYDWVQPGSDDLEEKVSYVKMTNHQNWVVGTGVYVSDVEEAFEQQLRDTLIITLLLLIGLVGVSSLISRNIIRPLQKVTKTMEQIADEKDLTIEMKGQGKDELSVMARSFNKMNQNIKSVISDINSSTSSLASQAEELSTVTVQIQSGVVEQKAKTVAVSESVNQLADVSQTVSDKANIALERVSHAAQSAESANRSIHDNIKVIGSAADKVKSAVVTAESLENSSSKIGNIIEVITQIAEQTNLLALNAAIEAARAGEQGRGFAVVADEVRTLASRTQESTCTIQALISDLQSDVNTTVDVMRDCDKYTAAGIEKANVCGLELAKIEEAVSAINLIVNEINAFSKQQSEQASEINEHIVNIATVAEQTENGSLQTSQSSEQLSDMAQRLNHLVNSFKL